MRSLTAKPTLSWWSATRLLLCLFAAALWLLLALAMTRVAYARGGDIDNCRFNERRDAIGVHDNWPRPRYTCIFERPDGTIVEVHRSGLPITIFATGAAFGLVPATALLWIGLGRPRPSRQRRSPVT